jgi:hypothetical protein
MRESGLMVSTLFYQLSQSVNHGMDYEYVKKSWQFFRGNRQKYSWPPFY